MKSLAGIRKLNEILGVSGAPLGMANDRGHITPLPWATPSFLHVRRIYDEARSILASRGIYPHGENMLRNGYNKKVSDLVGVLLSKYGIYEEC